MHIGIYSSGWATKVVYSKKSNYINTTQCTILCQIISNAKKTTIQKFFFFFFTIWHENHLPSRSKLCKTCSHNQNLYIYWKKSLTLSSKCHYARITSLIGVKQKLNQDNEFNVFKNWLKWWSRWTINTTWTILNQPQGKNCKLKILQITECGISFFSCKKFICK